MRVREFFVPTAPGVGAVSGMIMHEAARDEVVRREVSGGENDPIGLDGLAAGEHELRTSAARCDVNDLVVNRGNLDSTRPGQGL